MDNAQCSLRKCAIFNGQLIAGAALGSRRCVPGTLHKLLHASRPLSNKRQPQAYPLFLSFPLLVCVLVCVCVCMCVNSTLMWQCSYLNWISHGIGHRERSLLSAACGHQIPIITVLYICIHRCIERVALVSLQPAHPHGNPLESHSQT